jgi:F-type H+-transporting ATPase subunit delta
MDLLPFISSELDRAIEEAQGSIKAYVKSATPLDETSKEQIRKGLEKILNKKILLEISVHPELLAGMVLQAGDTVIDNSLKSQLKNLENKLRFEYGY